jgi:hypothetical protein
MKKMILKTLTSFNTNVRNSTNHAPSLCASLLIPLLIGCFALLPTAQAAPEKVTATPDATANAHPQVIPVPAAPQRVPAAPEMALAGFNTADGDHALFSITTGIANTAVGWYSLFANTDGSFNTAVGAGTLVLNIGDQTTGEGLENTAVGAAALLFNTTGSSNTALGVLALENNTSGIGSTAVGIGALQQNTGLGSSTAVGFDALINNQDGINNAAFGVRPLESNTSGNNNTAIGNLALQNSQGDSNTALGRLAGSGVTTASNVICIGHGVAGENVDNSCYIGNIANQNIITANAAFVFADLTTGKLGTVLVNANGNKMTVPSPLGGQPQAMLNEFLKGQKRVAELESTIAQQAKTMETLTAQIKEQAAQIQKVSAQVELSKPAPRMVASDQ